jgi:hypothetical protein
VEAGGEARAAWRGAAREGGRWCAVAGTMLRWTGRRGGGREEEEEEWRAGGEKGGWEVGRGGF